jgi:hypothetical protein
MKFESVENSEEGEIGRFQSICLEKLKKRNTGI